MVGIEFTRSTQIGRRGWLPFSAWLLTKGDDKNNETGVQFLCAQVECATGYAQPRGWVSVLYIFGKRRAVKFTLFKGPFYGDETKLTGS
jgi:hypothetical protein